MLTNATADKLREMKLGIMATQFKDQLMSPDMADLSFDVEYHADRGLDKSLILRLGTCTGLP